jgi:hypothetical protein
MLFAGTLYIFRELKAGEVKAREVKARELKDTLNF